MNCNIMVDIETLGTRPGCTILSIAAVPFYCQHSLDPFYVRISSADSLLNGFHVDDTVVTWWKMQSEEAQLEAFGGVLGIRSALAQFADYCAALPGAPILWGNGADFDNAILAEAFFKMDMPLPWKYYNSRCFRTLKNLFPEVSAVKSDMAHNALHDAKTQANQAERILLLIQRLSAKSTPCANHYLEE